MVARWQSLARQHAAAADRAQQNALVEHGHEVHRVVGAGDHPLAVEAARDSVVVVQQRAAA